ncbi:MarR family winged helix-turn-helix transcriptional regulator [Bauldia litoralis]|uniref:MarR family winged helix-turn-helix transcriptional regulator n=1 Tax=Bauldia litoralis TaxID=665467 RepID=UPI003265F3FD
MERRSASLHLLLHAAHLVEEALRDDFAAIGIQPRQARVLDTLERLGEVTQAEMARAHSVTAASMSTMIDRLADAGLVERRQHPQRRRDHIVSLTARGRDLLGAVDQVWQRCDERIESLIGKRQAKEYFATTRALRDGLGGEAPHRRAAKTAG